MPAWRAADVDDGLVAALASELRVRPLTARLLVGRGFSEAAPAGRFLEPRLGDLRPPDGMADLDRALDRLARAIAGKERIGVFGDYDVDGVTTAAILTTTLRALGAEVVPRAASRASGYGLGPPEAARFADEGCRVLVTGDCGTSDFDALRLCRDRGVDAIVIDHHQVPSGEKLAFALINPHQTHDAFAFKGLASCGVAFYIAAALRTRLREAGHAAAEGFDPRDLLDLVALGTIADLVPLRDENRILVSAGLRQIARRRRPGLAALCAVAEIDAGPVTVTDVSFRLAPRLNAAGRLGEAQASLDLLLASDDEEGRRRAGELDDMNRERQRIQERVVTEALGAAEAEVNAGAAAIVVGAEGWHHGVVGIVAAKLVDRFGRPAIVIGFENGQGRGSARTTGGFNLYEALRASASHLGRYGGHAAAAGLSIEAAALPAFRADFVAEAARHFAGHVAGPLAVDAVVDLADLDVAAAEEIDRLSPFGVANPEPLFALSGVMARSTRKVGKGHLQLTLSSGGATGDAIAFGMAERDPGEGARLDVLAHAEVDVFRGNRRARLRVKHIYRSSPDG